MANIKSSKKRIKVAEAKRVQNVARKSEIKTYLKKFKATPTQELLNECYSLIDVAAGHGIYHPNKAARMKAKLAKQVQTA